MPCLLKNPFSKAIIKGTDSIMGIYPSLTFVVSGFCSELVLAAT